MCSAETYLEFVHDVLISLHANSRDLREKLLFCDPEERDYLEGRLMSYQEVLLILRTSAQDFGVQGEIGL